MRLTRIDLALQEIDDVEGFKGFGYQDSLFRRILVDVEVGDGRVRQAWTYVYAGDATVVPIIPSGDWRIHRGRKQECLRAIAAAHCCGRPESELGRIIADKNPWFDGDRDRKAAMYLPVWRAIEDHRISERRLAQASGVWTAWTAR